MTALTKEVKTFRCDTEAEIEKTITDTSNSLASFKLTKKEVKFKQLKKKGEIIDEYWILTLTFEIVDE